MNIIRKMLKTTTVFAVVFSFVACEDDFETVGGEIIGEPGFTTDLYEEAEISVVNNNVAPVQTNNLPVNLLGVYSDPVFGDQVANILTQVSLTTVDPTFGDSPVLDSVVLHIPYFSEKLENDEDGNAQYELDSIYGVEPVKISVLESNYFLNKFDPDTDFEEAQKYYSDMEEQIEGELTGAVIGEVENFIPSADEVVEITATDTLRHAPRLKMKLNSDYFKSKILDMEGSSELSSRNNFLNYLRSIYLKTEKIGAEGTMMLLNLMHADAGITMYYTVKEPDEDDVDDDGDVEELIDSPRTYSFTFGPTRVNTFQQDTIDFMDASSIYLKGGEGSMAIIDLFSGVDSDDDGVSDELEFLREKDWLINEANLEFYVNRNAINGVNEAERLYLYDLTNNRPLADYVLGSPGQGSSMESDQNDSHLVPLEVNESGEGILYKVRITDHVLNMLKNDAENVRLGLVVSENVNMIFPSAVKQTEDAKLEKIPATSVITPEATVIYGPEAQNDEKRLKLRIYYTESK